MFVGIPEIFDLSLVAMRISLTGGPLRSKVSLSCCLEYILSGIVFHTKSVSPKV